MINLRMFHILCFGLILLSVSKADGSEPYKNCLQDSARQEARSKELPDIVNADQADRAAAPNIPEAQWPHILKRDLKRRQRVVEIFGEGCLKNSADYTVVLVEKLLVASQASRIFYAIA